MSSDGSQLDRPRFTSVTLYNDPSGLLSFWFAAQWHLLAGSSSPPSITLIPDLLDPETHMAITVRDIGSSVVPADRPAIVQGVRDGLAQLDSCQLEALAEVDVGGCWGVEWRCTFMANGQRHQRRGRLFFNGRYQYAVVFQGSTEERFCHWQGMFEWTMLTVAAKPFDAQQWLESANPPPTT